MNDDDTGSGRADGKPLFRTCTPDTWKESKRIARARRLTKTERSLWSVTFDALAKNPDLAREFAEGIRSELLATPEMTRAAAVGPYPVDIEGD